ncbi:hypothetical protein BDQ17DRAFT_1329751 [Cyathus striatus]|nr:hypothetical protein BDQ17DRAFT_1329751 [Cyathus striatus]
MPCNINKLSIILMIFEYTITFELEVTFVWKSPWTLGKVLYLVEWAQQKVGVIFTLRTWALWERNKWLAYFLFVYYITSWVGTIVAAGISVNTLEFGAQQYIARGCLVTGGNSSLILVDWTLLFVYDFGDFSADMLMVLVLIPAFKAFKQNEKSYILKTVLRDGIIYYMYLFVVSLANLVVIRTLSPDYFNVILVTVGYQELGHTWNPVIAHPPASTSTICANFLYSTIATLLYIEKFRTSLIATTKNG